MHIFSISGLSVGISCVIVSAITLFFGKTKLHRVLLLFNLVVTVWGAGLFLVGNASNETEALAAWRIAHLGGFFVGPSFYFLTCVFCRLQRRKVLYFGYIQAIVTVIISFTTDLLFNRTRYVYDIYFYEAGPLYLIGVIVYLAFVFLSYLELFRFLKISRGHQRLQTLYVIFGFMFGFVGATTTFLPMFGLDVIYPLGNFGITVYVAVLTYAFLRHRLLDIHLIFRRTMVYSITAGLLIGIFVVLVLSMTRTLSDLAGITSFTITVIAALIIAFLFHPLRNRVQLIVNKLFYRDAIDYYSFVKETSHQLAITVNADDIQKLIVDSIFSALRLNSSYLLSSNDTHYRVNYFRLSRDMQQDGDKALNHTLENDSELIIHLRDRKNIITREDLAILDKDSAEMIITLLRAFSGEVIVPIINDNEPVCLLILGDKLSGEIYSAEDIKLIQTITNQAAISLKNALLYDELQVKVKELETANTKISDNRKSLQQALVQVSSLIESVIQHKDVHVRFDNHTLQKCYELKNCDKTECPCYGREPMRCWSVTGTFCGGNVQGKFASKFKSCIECVVYRKAVSDPSLTMGEHFNNMMHVLELEHMELDKTYKELANTQSQMLQQEKMASIGQLAAGVAHEINNPNSFVSSNLGTLHNYFCKLTEFIKAQSDALDTFASDGMGRELMEKKKKIKVDYVLSDTEDLIQESLDGTERIKKIVQNMKSLARDDGSDFALADINDCIESTLNIAWNELKYKATVEKDYGDIPFTKCNPQQINQVIMNLLVNASHAIERQGEIKIKTWNGEGYINISVSDTGCGIPEDQTSVIFDPFFTTKEVGKGTGLGLSISYEIVKKHNGEMTVESEVGKGTSFKIRIPVID